MTTAAARYGWASDFPEFRSTPAYAIRGSLEAFLREVAASQVDAWNESIPPLQHEVDQVLEHDRAASDYSVILEYELPLEFRRPDVVLLTNGGVLVLELKSKPVADWADVDQAAAYRRDLLAYHRDCENRPVHAAVVLTRASGSLGERSGVHVLGLDAVDQLVEVLDRPLPGDRVPTERFLSVDAYRPLPTLIQAARELFEHGELRHIKRAAAATGPAVEAISRIVHEAARTRSRRLVLLTGVPGAGKTLVGLQIVHARFLDDLAQVRPGGKSTTPAVFLSGNGPLVQVLQYELRAAGGGGKAFVRDVKPYVRTYASNPSRVPPEHVIVFDEAQRAWDSYQVGSKHPEMGPGRSEPEHFIEFAERIPGWAVVIGLIGSGQEIHQGEEAGMGQWGAALDQSGRPDDWTVHGPPSADPSLVSLPNFQADAALTLDDGIRYHLASPLDQYVEGLLDERSDIDVARLADHLEANGYHLRLTQDLDEGKRYLRERYRDAPEARFGLIASAKDRDLWRFGVPNDYQSTKLVRYGPWYSDGEEHPDSCRHLRTAVTEFGAQGLELDATLVAWGTDFIRQEGVWTNRLARPYARGSNVHDPFRLRVNAYRVLLTRARDAAVVFVPPLPALGETYSYLVRAGFKPLDLAGSER